VKLLLLLALVIVPFAVFWLAGRGITPRVDGQDENAREALRNDRW
jgi:hypothetical protein